MKGAINAFIMWFIIMLAVTLLILLSAYQLSQKFSGNAPGG